MQEVYWWVLSGSICKRPKKAGLGRGRSWLWYSHIEISFQSYGELWIWDGHSECPLWNTLPLRRGHAPGWGCFLLTRAIPRDKLNWHPSAANTPSNWRTERLNHKGRSGQHSTASSAHWQHYNAESLFFHLSRGQSPGDTSVGSSHYTVSLSRTETISFLSAPDM